MKSFLKRLWAAIRKPVAIFWIILSCIFFLTAVIGGLVVTAKPWLWPIGLCILFVGFLALPGLFWLIGGLREWTR